MMNDDLRFARYLRDRGQVVLAKDLVLESLVSSSDVGWLEVAIVGDDVENLSALCAAIVGGPFYGIARSLGEALGRLRQLPRLGPILDGENIDDLDFEAELSGFLELMRRVRARLAGA